MKILLIIPALLLSVLVIGQTVENDILGVWLTQSKDAKIKIYKKNDHYYGMVIWIASPNDENGKPVVDSKNPDQKLKSRPILGMDIITKMSYANKEWSGGKIYDPKNGELYTCKLWFENGKLKVRGYLGWFYETKTWSRVS